MNALAILTCKATKKRYVCVSKNGKRNPGKDFNPLTYGHGHRFIEAVKKYGRNNFTIRILGFGYRTRESLHKEERKAIKRFNTLWPNGYNVTRGGWGPDYGPQHGEAISLGCKKPGAKKRRSEASIKRWKDPSYRKRHRVAMKEAIAKPGYKKKLKKASQANWKNPVYRKLVSKKVRKAKLIQWADSKYKERVRQCVIKWWSKRKGRARKHSRKTKAKMSAATKGRPWSNIRRAAQERRKGKPYKHRRHK